MKLDSGKSGRVELPLTTYISGQTEARKNLPRKPPGEKKGAGNLGRKQGSSSKVLPTGLLHGKRETTT